MTATSVTNTDAGNTSQILAITALDPAHNSYANGQEDTPLQALPIATGGASAMDVEEEIAAGGDGGPPLEVEEDDI
jgi:hypothetical protein